MILTEIKTKTDVSKVLSLKEIKIAAAIEVLTDAAANEAAGKAKSLLRQKRKLYIIILERD